MKVEDWFENMVQPDVNTPQRKSPLRVALLVNSYVQPRWIHKVISNIVSSHIATLVLIVANDDARPAPRQKAGYFFSKFNHLAYKLYTRVDNFLFTEGPDALESLDLTSLLAHVPRLYVKPIKKRFSDEFADQDTETLAGYDLDVILRFGFGILKGAVLQLPRYGVWSYHHGDNTKYRGGPPAFWEVMQAEPSTGVVLQVLSDQLDNGRVIAKSLADTDKWSVKRNANRCYWQASEFVLRKLHQVYEKGHCALANSAGTTWNCYSGPLFKIPTNGLMCRLLIKFAGRYLSAKITHLLYFNQWMLAYKIRPNQAVRDQTFYNFKHLRPPRDRFWADPFPVEKDGRYYIFFEELLFKTGKGHLSVMEVDQRGIVNGPRKILERPYHLSYPFVFFWEGEFYMIPETSKAGTVEVYRCTAFPDEWQFETTLLSGIRAVDTTLAELNGRWWMFTSIQVEGMRELYELHLYYADNPLGPWTAHKHNPVRADAHSSRPAGRIIENAGSYYRPAQEGPGRSMFIYKLKQVDPDGYLEAEDGRIFPEWTKNLIGTHTFNSSSGLTVIDVQIRRRRYV